MVPYCKACLYWASQYYHLNHLCCRLPRQKKKKGNKTPFRRYLLPGSNHDAKARAFSRGFYSIAPWSKGWSVLDFRKAKFSLRSSYENHWGFRAFKWTFPIRSMSRTLTIQWGIFGGDWSLIFPTLIQGLRDYFTTFKLAGSLAKTVWPSQSFPCTHLHSSSAQPHLLFAPKWHRSCSLPQDLPAPVLAEWTCQRV